LSVLVGVAAVLEGLVALVEAQAPLHLELRLFLQYRQPAVAVARVMLSIAAAVAGQVLAVL
jgi:hypothetical protein